MKREIAAILFSGLLIGAANAETIQRSELPAPAQPAAPDSDALSTLIRKSINEPEAKRAPKPMPEPAAPLSDYSAGPDYSTIPIDLWLHGIPETPVQSLDAIANSLQRYPAARQVTRQGFVIPKELGYNQGHIRAKFSASVNSPENTSVVPIETYAGAIPSPSTGVISGRVEYDATKWELYGGTNRNIVAEINGTATVSNTLIGGTYYKLPADLTGGKIGTGFEVNPVGDAKTRLEYRRMFGTTEGFVAAERTVPFHALPAQEYTPNLGIRTGINRKF